MDSTPLIAAAAVVFGAQWLAFVPAYAARTERFYDLVGAMSWIGATVTALVLSGATGRAILLSVMVVAWAGRLGHFLVRRIHRDGGDGRFDTIKTKPVRFFFTWTLQGVWITVTGSAAALAMAANDAGQLGWTGALGAGIWLGGFTIEVAADRQKRMHRRDHPGKFITSGLWAWSRHPNYFGEVTLWCGVSLVAVGGLGDLWWAALVSPLFVAALLTQVSGIPMLERRGQERWGDDPAYQRYVENTPVLVPRPPRSASRG
ncbi:MAG: steroid 5-alpha reductase family enzyme [Myxococcota bacterium]|jgi:steroid 5-alpha reductase family enzyme